MAASTSTAQPRIQATVPTTVGQILSCKDTQFRICDTPIQIVWLVGVIRNLKAELFEISCKIQDHSGVIKGIMRFESEVEVASKVSKMKQNSYAKVFGFVRSNGGDKEVLMLKVIHVDDANVITNHLLQAYHYVLEARAKRKKQLATANTSGAALADSVAMFEDVENNDETMEEPQFNDFQRLVYNIVRSECSENGITKRNVLRQFPSYQGHDVNQALDYLINEGIIYYSIDQEHLKVVSS